MVKFHCEACDEHKPVIIEELQQDELNGLMICGDIVCTECNFVIATISADTPGKYKIIRDGFVRDMIFSPKPPEPQTVFVPVPMEGPYRG